MFAAIFDFGLDSSTWPWVWLGIAVVLALVELFLVPGSFVFFPWAIMALVASLLAFAEVSVATQWIVFIFGGAILFVLMFAWVRRFNESDEQPPGMGADRLVGLNGIVTVAIDPNDASRSGKVSVEGESWGAITDTPSVLNAGTHVIVREMRGTRVVVSPE